MDDQVLRGDIKFAYQVFNTFLQRVDERVGWVEGLVAMEHDFTIDEEILRDPDAATYARSEAEAREMWRKRVKFDFLRLRVDDEEKMPVEKQKEKVLRRYTSFAKRMHQTDREELLEMYLSAMTMSLDAHTSYMCRPGEFRNRCFGARAGRGLVVDGYTVVNKIIPGGAAGKDGRLKPEDRIVGVGQGVDGEIVDVVDMKLSDVVDLIRGRRNTVVRLEVTDKDGLNSRIIDITRAKIELKDSEAQKAIFEVGSKPSGGT